MKTKQLPQGWKEVELGELIKLRGGFAFKSMEFVKEGVPLVRISNFNNDEVNLNEAVFVSFEEYEKYPELHLRENDLLIAMSGATTGKVGIISKKNLPCLLNQRVGRFEILEQELNWKYLYLFIKSKKFQNKVLSTAGGCAQPNISGKQIESIKILLPPSAVQQKIISILEKAEQLKEKRKKSIEILDEYLKAVFSEMFLKERFEIKKLNEICDTSSGGTPSRGKKEYWESGTIPWIKSGDLNKNQVFSVDEFITEEGLKNSSARYIEPDTVLIAMYGATAGKTSISRIKATTNQAVCAIVPKTHNLNKLYLLYLLRSKYNQIVSLSFGGGQPNISQQVIRSLKIPLPPIELQQQFASIVKHVEKLKEKQKKSQDESEDLFNALMQQAFLGELVK